MSDQSAVKAAKWPVILGSAGFVCMVTAALGSSAGVASARPFCFETGPGYQKCVTSGHDLTPIYQGPKIYDGGNVPWVPTYSPPLPAAPVAPAVDPAYALDALSGVVLGNIQRTLDADPANAQANIRVRNVSLTQTGNTTFEGVAMMTANGGPPRDIPVHIFNDDNGNLSWKIDPGAMAVLAQ